MRRRTIVLGGAAGAMLAAVRVRAQQRGRTYRIGILMPASGKGAKPADLPVEQMERYSLVLNMKRAKSLAITIPQSVLLRADRVIE